MKKEFIGVLLKVQKELPIVGRTTEAFKYKYAPIEHVWDKVGNVLSDNGFVITNEISEAGVKTNAFHEQGELNSFIAFSNLTLKPQDRGSEITYARRYNLTAMFNIIVAGEDDNAQATKDAKQKSFLDEIQKIVTIDELKKYYELNKTKYPSTEFAKAVTARKEYLEIPVINQNEEA